MAANRVSRGGRVQANSVFRVPHGEQSAGVCPDQVAENGLANAEVDPDNLVTKVRYIETGSDFHSLARFLETVVND